MNNLIRRAIFQFIPSWAVGFLLASVFHSSAVLIGLLRIEVELTPNDWLIMIWHDLLGLLPTYGVIIAATLLLAFLITHFIVNRTGSRFPKQRLSRIRFALFATAGGLSFLLMLLAMQPILNVTLIAGARSTLGLLAQCFAGICAGGVYSYLSNSYTNN